MSKRLTLAALAALPIAFAAAGAQAQQARYCDGRIVANSFYSNVQLDGPATHVTYYVQLQNTGYHAVLYTVSFDPRRTFSYSLSVAPMQNGTSVEMLGGDQRLAVMLARQTLATNQGTRGMLTLTDLARVTSVSCPG